MRIRVLVLIIAIVTIIYLFINLYKLFTLEGTHMNWSWF